MPLAKQYVRNQVGSVGLGSCEDSIREGNVGVYSSKGSRGNWKGRFHESKEKARKVSGGRDAWAELSKVGVSGKGILQAEGTS